MDTCVELAMKRRKERSERVREMVNYIMCRATRKKKTVFKHKPKERSKIKALIKCLKKST